MATTPNILRETSRGIHELSILDYMLERREVECVGVIDSDLVYSLCRQLRYLEDINPNEPITMLINSPGGSIADGMALYDVMQGLSCEVRTVCLGAAYSMGSLLFAGGNTRHILPHGTVMVHNPLISQTGGSTLKIYEEGKRLMELRETLSKLLAKHCGRTLEEVYEKCDRETYFDAPQAVDFGLADAIITKIR